MDKFEELYKKIHEENIKKYQEEYFKRQQNGESVYLNFCIWCNAYHKGEGKDNAELFGIYLKETGKDLNFWQKKYIAEKYFNWVYEWDYYNEKWNIKKKVC